MKLATPPMLSLAALACGGPSDPIPCTSTAQCDLHLGGLCVRASTGNQWCRYHDDGCPSGYRWSEQAGDGLSGQCVEGAAAMDAGADSPMSLVDAGPDARDTTPPDTMIISAPSAISGPNVTFAFQSTEPGSFECSLDGAAFTACVSGKSYSGLTAGTHDFQVRAVDNSGNRDPTPDTHHWQVDPNVLDTTITVGPAATSGRSVTFEFTATRPGTFECKLAPVEASFTACTRRPPHRRVGGAVLGGP